MFDITGTMWLVYILFVYGLKSIWLPWLWPTFNQVFLMMFLSGWMRRSNVLTGAQWIETRFGRDRGASLAHLSVVLFALVNVVGMLAYAFNGIGKFAVVMLPWRFTESTSGLVTNENIYAVVILLVTSLYAIKGGMISVVFTEVMQFTILTVTALVHRRHRDHHGVAGDGPLPGARGLDEPVLRLAPRPRLDGRLRQGERRDPGGRQRALRASSSG